MPSEKFSGGLSNCSQRLLLRRTRLFDLQPLYLFQGGEGEIVPQRDGLQAKVDEDVVRRTKRVTSTGPLAIADAPPACSAIVPASRDDRPLAACTVLTGTTVALNRESMSQKDDVPLAYPLATQVMDTFLANNQVMKVTMDCEESPSNRPTVGR